MRDDARSEFGQKGGGTISPKFGKLMKLGKVGFEFEKKGVPNPAGLSSRGITRKGLCGVPPYYKNRNKVNNTYNYIRKRRWTRELRGGLSTPRS